MDAGGVGVESARVANAIDLVDGETGKRVRLVPGLAWKEKDRVLRASKRHTDVGHRVLAYYLSDMDERRESQLLGYPSAAEYAVHRLDMPRRSARELIQVGRALCELTKIDRAFAEGSLSWSRVRLLAKIATPETEDAWLECGRKGSWPDFELAFKLGEKGKPPPKDRKGLPELRLKVPVQLDAIAHEIWTQAKHKLGAERGEPVLDGEALRTFAHLFLGTSPAGVPEERTRSAESTFRVSVHLCPGCDSADLQTADGPMPVAPSGLAPYVAEAEITGVRESAAPQGHGVAQELDRTTPPWMRDEVLARDGFHCAHCRSRRNLMVHHIVWRSKGGPTIPSNLIAVCVDCHVLIHAQTLVVAGEAPHEVHWSDSAGHSTQGPIESQAALTIDLPTAEDDPPASPEGPAEPRAFELLSLPDRVPTALLGRILHLLHWNDRRGLFTFEPGAPRPHPEGEADKAGISIPDHRPAGLSQVVGQTRTVATLEQAVRAAQKRGEAVCHTLLLGGPGLGKSSLMRAMAADMGSRAHLTSGPHLRDLGALLQLLTQLGSFDLLGIDEIHALPSRVAEALYEAMEDRVLTLPLSDGQNVRTLTLELPPFTVVGATTETAALAKPLVMRFALREMLDWYDSDQLARILTRAADRSQIVLTPEAALVLARAGRDTPREALALLTRVRNAAVASGQSEIHADFASSTLTSQGIDPNGLDATDRRLLDLLAARRHPIGGTRLAALLGITPAILRDVHEPFLVRRGLLLITPRGRSLGP